MLLENLRPQARLAVLHPDARVADLPAVSGAPGERLYDLNADSISIGRGDGCTICVDLPTVSRLHAEILLRGQRYLIRDADSSNHTYVSGQRLIADAWHRLRDQDEIRLGSLLVLRFIDLGRTAPEPRASGDTTVESGAVGLRWVANEQEFYLRGRLVELPPLQKQLLLRLYERQGGVCPYKDCYRALYPGVDDALFDEVPVRYHITQLRQRLKRAASEADAERAGHDWIKNIRGSGYCLVQTSPT